jgi:prepilin-type processing-associated H-X9-DG protein
MVTCPKCGTPLPSAGRACLSCGADVAVWLARGDQVYGPYTMADIGRARSEGRLDVADKVKVGDRGNWRPLADLLDESSALPPAAFAPMGTVAQPMSALSPPARTGTGMNGVGVVLAVIGIALVLAIAVAAAGLVPVFTRARGKAQQASCMANEKQISLGLLMYCQDYGERYPRRPATPIVENPAAGNAGAERTTGRPGAAPPPSYAPEDWRTLIFPYLKNLQIFVCPTTNSAYSYQLNDVLRARRLADIARPAQFAALYDNGFLTGSPAPPHDGGHNVGFVDGHVKWMKGRGDVITTLPPEAPGQERAGEPAGRVPGRPGMPALPAEAPQNPAAKASAGIHPDLVEALHAAKAEKKILLVDFYGAWCPWCVKMDATLADPEVKALLAARFHYLKLDIGHFDSHKDCVRQYGVTGIPHLVVFGSDGSVRMSAPGYQAPAALLAFLKKAAQ